MTTNGLLKFLEGAPYGAFAVNMNKTILFWNRGAEQILERKPEEAIGRTCCEVIAEITQDGNGPLCAEGCPSVAFAIRGEVPAIVNVEVLSGSGQSKLITLTPLIVHEDLAGQRLLVLLFHDLRDSEGAGRKADTVGENLSLKRSTREPNELATYEGTHKADLLTRRELEVLRLVAVGNNNDEISAELNISSHTVLNHIRNLRSKLNVRDKLGAVLASHRSGLL